MASPSFDRIRPSRAEQPSVGHALRTRREELGWEIEAVAEWLRIRARLLSALEEDNLSAFPGTAYAVGFLRTYANALGLDAENLVGSLTRQFQGVMSRKPELVFPQPQDDRSIPVGVLIGAGLLVVVAAYAGWYRFVDHDVPAERKIPAVAELMSGAATPLTTSPQVASVMPAQAPAPQRDDRQAMVGRTMTPVPASPAFAVPVPSTVAPVTPVRGAQGEGATPPEEGSASVVSKASVSGAVVPPPSAVPVQTGRIGVHAQASVWTQIRDQDGHVVLSRVLQPGETWTSDGASPVYTATFGNAGGVVLTLDGITTAPLGPEGAVRRNIRVTADAIRSGAFGRGLSGPVGAPAPETTTPTDHGQPARHTGSRAALRHLSGPSADELNARQLDQASASH